MKVKTMKILLFIATALLVISMAASVVYGASPSDVKPIQGEGEEEILNFGGRIIGILQTVGVVLSVVILTILGIKYMMGSAEEKAEYKKTMIPYVVGAILIFAASTIANVVYQFAIGLNTAA